MSEDNRHRISVFAQTDVGMVRAGNEDTFLVLNLDTTDTWTPVTVEDDPPDDLSSFAVGDHGTLFAVSDGMGGALAGEVASRMAVDGVREHMLYFKSTRQFAKFPFHERLRLAVEQANTHINNESLGNADYAGMGATFTAAGIDGDTLTIAQIGDSRCYLIRNGQISLITHDQSLVWQLVEAGHITEEEAETHQYKNVILQALGAQPRVNVVVDRLKLGKGDTFLLCSDGLSGRVRADEMLQIIEEAESLRVACDRLIDLANERGGEDNITVILAQVDGDNLPEPGEVRCERIDRDPNLPYDLDVDLLADSEPTLSPDAESADAITQDDLEVVADPPADEAEVGDEETEEEEEEDKGVSSAERAKITAGLAEKIALLNEQANVPVVTSVGIPAITDEQLEELKRARGNTEEEEEKTEKEEEEEEEAETAESSAEAADPPEDDDEPTLERPKPEPPAASTKADDDAKGGQSGLVSLVAILVFGSIVAVSWYIYQQRTERAEASSSARQLEQRYQSARNQVDTMSPRIDQLLPGSQKEHAIQIKANVLATLESVRPLINPEQAHTESVARADQLMAQVDTDLKSLAEVLSTPPPPPPVPENANSLPSPDTNTNTAPPENSNASQ